MKAMLALGLVMSLSAPAAAPPKRMLWHWFSNGDVSSVKPEEAGIAFHALSLALKGTDPPAAYPRRSPLVIAPGVYRMAVVRIEERKASFTAAQRTQTAGMIVEIASIMRVPAVQIDFDAPQSAWPFYRELIKDVRSRLGPNVFLSITALTSWCGRESWMNGLDVDETVPMAFDMGAGGPATVAMLRSGGQFEFPGCRTSLGMSLTEASLPVRLQQRLYIFANNRNWSPALAQATLARYRR